MGGPEKKGVQSEETSVSQESPPTPAPANSNPLGHPFMSTHLAVPLGTVLIRWPKSQSRLPCWSHVPATIGGQNDPGGNHGPTDCGQ